jgi:hypothetical protein
MRVNVVGRVQRASHDGTVPHGEYSVAVGPITDGNRRPDTGMVLTAGRRRFEVQAYDWHRAIKSGAIEEIKDGGEMSNLPAVKAEMAVVPVSPQEQMNQAADMAKLLKTVVAQAGLARKLGGRKEHLEFEAWQTIARWHHCTPSTEWTRPIKDGEKIIGWEARVNVLDEQGRVIGSSEGMCMADEPNWRGKPSYALRSMAQTRTAGKALRSLFAHIAVLAGYSPTPAEEMDGVDVREEAPPRSAPQAEKPKAAANGDHATEAQRKALFAKGMARWDNRDRVKEFADYLLEAAGAEHFTRKYMSECLDDFDTRAADFEQA